MSGSLKRKKEKEMQEREASLANGGGGRGGVAGGRTVVAHGRQKTWTDVWRRPSETEWLTDAAT